MRRSGSLLVLSTALWIGAAGCKDPNGLFGTGGDTTIDPGGPDIATPKPSFGQTITQADRPPPVSGGTLLVTANQKYAVAADPDRDLVDIVDLDSRRLVTAVALKPHDEPGRLVEDGAGLVHVALRRTGILSTIDVVAGKEIDRHAICPAPRGLAYDAKNDLLHVACAGGELITLRAADRSVARSLRLERDLRDVVVDDDQLQVSVFRTAEILTVDLTGNIIDQRWPNDFSSPGIHSGAQFAPGVAWRMIGDPSGGVIISHERSATATGSQPVPTDTPGGYGGGGFGSCGNSNGIVHGTATVLPRGVWKTKPAGVMMNVTLPVDIAVAPDGRLAVADAAESKLFGTGVTVYGSGFGFTGDCEFNQEPNITDGGPTGQPTAVTFTRKGELVVQSREPAMLRIVASDLFSTEKVDLAGPSRADTGHDIFHSNSGVGIACASCHPEGGDDARTWTFDPIGARRTQSLRGGIAARAPYHWDGDLHDIPALLSEVMVKRMSGPDITTEQADAVRGYIDAIPALAPSTSADAAAVERGRALFNDPNGGNCASCHSGSHFTNDQRVDVGTGAAFKVPTLTNIAFRAPFIHDGRAQTLRDRFNDGGQDRHGRTSQLTDAQKADLIAFLESL